MSPWICILTGFFVLSTAIQSNAPDENKRRQYGKKMRRRRIRPATPMVVGQDTRKTVDQWFDFWSQYTPSDPKTHVVSRSAKRRKIILDYPAGYVIVDEAFKAHRYDFIPANTWVDHKTGMIIDDDEEINRIRTVEGQILSSDKNITDQKINMGYLPVLNTSEKKNRLDVQIVDGVVTLSGFMKKKRARQNIKKSTSLTVNGWRFNIKESKEAVYGVGVKDNRSITLFRQNRYRPGGIQPSNKDLVCSAIEQKDDTLQVYTYDHIIMGKQMAQQALVREISHAIGRNIQLSDILWDAQNQAPKFFPSGQTRRWFHARRHVHPRHRAMMNKESVHTVYSSIPFEGGQLKNPPLGFLHFGISQKANAKAIPDQTGTYYVYVDYVVCKEESAPMDKDFLMLIGEQMRSRRFEKVNALSSDQKDTIYKPVDERQGRSFADTNIILIPSSDGAYDGNRGTDLDEPSTPVAHTGVHFTLPSDQYTRILENGEFYAYGRDQSGIRWEKELARMAENIENQGMPVIHRKNTETYQINGWTLECYIGKKGVYGFAHDGGRTISFGQVIKQGMPLNIVDIFYKAWKIFDKNFKNLRLILKLENNETESNMMDILYNKLFILTGQNLNQVKLESKDVQGVPFKMATVAFKTKQKIKGVLKYGISDQSKRPDTVPMIIVVGYISDSEKRRKTSADMDESMVGLLEKDLSTDFSRLIKGFFTDSQVDYMALSNDTSSPEGVWKQYAQLALSGL